MITLNQNTKTMQNCYLGTESFAINIFTEDMNNDAERWFDTSNYDKNDKRPLQIGVNKM